MDMNGDKALTSVTKVLVVRIAIKKRLLINTNEKC